MLKQRWIIDRISFNCRHCVAAFEKASDLVEHKKTCHTQEILYYPTLPQGRSSSTVQSVKRPNNVEKAAIDVKPIRIEAKSTDPSLNKHWPSLKRKPVFMCQLCSLKFPNFEKCLAHKKTKHPHLKQFLGDFNCEYCHSRYTDRRNYDAHMRNHRIKLKDSTDFPCHLCGKRFLSQFSLESHGAIYHDDLNAVGEGPEEQPKSEENDTSQYNIQDQENKPASPVFSSSNTNKSETAEYKPNHNVKPKSGRFACRFCSRQCTTMVRLHMHEKMHFGERQHKCRICEKVFTRNFTARTHERLIHGYVGEHQIVSVADEKHAQDEREDSEIPGTNSFTEVNEPHHSPVLAHNSVVQDEELHQSQALENDEGALEPDFHAMEDDFHDPGGHSPLAEDSVVDQDEPMINENDEEQVHNPKILVVPTFELVRIKRETHEGAGYEDQTEENQMEEDVPDFAPVITHVEGRSNLSCSFCAKTLRSITELQEHERVHTGERPFSCKICGKTFSRLRSQLAHERLDHGSLRTTRSSNKQVQPEPKPVPVKAMQPKQLEKSSLQSALQKHAAWMSATATTTTRQPPPLKLLRKPPALIPKTLAAPARRLSRTNSEIIRTPTPVVPASASVVSASVVIRRESPDDQLPIVHPSDRRKNGLIGMVTPAMKEKGTYTCPHCCKLYVDKYLLREHIRTHTGERPYKCYFCEKAFVRGRDQASHEMRIHGGRGPKTPRARRRLENPDTLTTQAPIKSQPSSPVNLAPVQTKNPGMRKLLDVYRKRKIYCKLCNRDFPTFEGLFSHRRLKHPHLMRKAGEYRCCFCHTVNTDKDTYNRHIRLHEQRIQENADFPCDLCDKRFLSRPKLDWHISEYHAETTAELQDSLSYQPSQPTRTIKHKIPSISQERQVVQQQPRIPGQKRKKRLKLIQCRYCEYVAKGSVSWREHERLHTGERPYPCRVCGKRFNRMRNRRSHELGTHKLQRNAIQASTQPVTQEYSSFEGSEDEEPVAPPVTKPSLICHFCDKSFATMTSLLIHVRTHQEERTAAPVTQTNYNPTAPTQSKPRHRAPPRARGQSSRTRNKKRSHGCKFCPEFFTSRGALFYHVNKVHREHRLECPHCDHSYTTESQLRLHLRTKHGINTDNIEFPENNYSISINQAGITEREEPYFHDEAAELAERIRNEYEMAAVHEENEAQGITNPLEDENREIRMQQLKEAYLGGLNLQPREKPHEYSDEAPEELTLEQIKMEHH